MRGFWDEILLRGGGGGGGGTVKLRKSVLFFFFFSSKNERIGNSCRDGTNKTLDFSLDLR